MTTHLCHGVSTCACWLLYALKLTLLFFAPFTPRERADKAGSYKTWSKVRWTIRSILISIHTMSRYPATTTTAALAASIYSDPVNEHKKVVRQRPEEVKEAFQTLEEAHHVLKHIIRTSTYSAQNNLLRSFFIAREC